MKRLLTFFAVIAIISAVRLIAFPQDMVKEANAATDDQEMLVSGGNTSGNNGIWDTTKKGLQQFYRFTGFRNATPGHLIMILVACFLFSLPSGTIMNLCC